MARTPIFKEKAEDRKVAQCSSYSDYHGALARVLVVVRPTFDIGSAREAVAAPVCLVSNGPDFGRVINTRRWWFFLVNCFNSYSAVTRIQLYN